MGPNCCAVGAAHSRRLPVAVGTLEGEADLRAIRLHQLLGIPGKSPDFIQMGVASASADIPTEAALLVVAVVGPAPTPPPLRVPATPPGVPTTSSSPAPRGLSSSTRLGVVVSSRTVVAPAMFVIRLQLKQFKYKNKNKLQNNSPPS